MFALVPFKAEHACRMTAMQEKILVYDHMEVTVFEFHVLL
jgi:hypothetical protein